MIHGRAVTASFLCYLQCGGAWHCIIPVIYTLQARDYQGSPNCIQCSCDMANWWRHYYMLRERELHNLNQSQNGKRPEPWKITGWKSIILWSYKQQSQAGALWALQNHSGLWPRNSHWKGSLSGKTSAESQCIIGKSEYCILIRWKSLGTQLTWETRYPAVSLVWTLPFCNLC